MELAERLCWSIINGSRQQRRHRTSWIELQALEKLAWVRFEQGHNAEAELLCLEVLQRNVQKKGNPSTHTVGTNACLILLQLCIEQGNYADAEMWQTMRLEGALCCSKLIYPTIFRHLQTLEDILGQQGKLEEIERLREDLEDIYQKWGEVGEGPNDLSAHDSPHLKL